MATVSRRTPCPRRAPTGDTRVADRDAHLKSPDFFDAAKHPSITFKSTKVAKAGKDRLKVTGDLTLRGVTKPVVLDVTTAPEVKGMFGETRRPRADHRFSPMSRRRLTWMLGALAALGPLSIDTAVPALPSMARALGASASAVQLTLAAYLAGIATGQLFHGPLSDRLGRSPPDRARSAPPSLAPPATAIRKRRSRKAAAAPRSVSRRRRDCCRLGTEFCLGQHCAVWGPGVR